MGRGGEREEPRGGNDVRNAANRKQYTAHVDDCRRTGNWVTGDHRGSGVSHAEVFPEHAGATEGGIQNEQRAADGESFGVHGGVDAGGDSATARADRKSTRLNSSHQIISYAVFCLKQKTAPVTPPPLPPH